MNSKLFKEIENDTIFTGGHFMIVNGKPNLNKGTIKSFELAVELYKRAKEKNKAGLGVLINDIGECCDSDVCPIINVKKFEREKFKLPDEYIKILSENKIKEEEVKIYWEKHVKNRAKKNLVKIVKAKQKNIKEMDGSYWFISYGVKIILSRMRDKDKYGSVACPLIMATFSKEQEQDGFHKSVNIYYIGEDNKLNIPNSFVIEKSKMLMEFIDYKINVKNVYFTDEKSLKII